MDRIALSEPEIRGNEWNYIKECLDSGWVSSAGEFVERFERQIAERVGVQHAVATSSGTAALHVALLAAGVRPDDEVLVSSLTFIAPANAIRYVGAWPVFIDSDPRYWQMDPEKVVGFLEDECRWHDGHLYNRHSGRIVRAILPVHILGHPVDMDPILQVARKYDIHVIEDAAEALGATYKDQAVGSMGDIACFSFNGNKIITSGGGGMIVTDRGDWANHARRLTTQAKDDPVEYVHREIAFNYRLSNIQAALGCAQLEHLDSYVNAKRAIAETYTSTLGSIPEITVPHQAEWAYSTFWLYTVLVDQECPVDSRALLSMLTQSGIQSRPLWQPLHLSAAHAGGADCAVAERLYAQGLSLPCSVGMCPDEQQRVLDTITRLATQS